ncbi:MAG: regulatory protein RecX [Oscillospiraceae bacterium]|nr:regulatory protein RecX [Oscillospiraceae bacterium]
MTLDNGEEIKTLLSVVADFSLYTGRELSDEEYADVVSASARGRAKERAVWIIGNRAHSEQEMYDKLVQKGETEENAAWCVAYLKSLHLLDDADYAAMTVRHYAAKGYGERRIRDELYRRKIPKEYWDAALEEMPEQDDKIDRLLRSRLKSEEPDRAEIKKATDFLLRRGFGWDEIKSALARYNSYIEEDY